MEAGQIRFNRFAKQAIMNHGRQKLLKDSAWFHPRDHLNLKRRHNEQTTASYTSGKPAKLGATRIALLDWWALYTSIRTEDTAIASMRFQNSVTVVAIVKILTRIGRHHFFFFVSALRARNSRNKDQFGSHDF
jgi:hypothetical protein